MFIANGSTKRDLKQNPAATSQDASGQARTSIEASTLQAHVLTLPHTSSHSGNLGLLSGVTDSHDVFQDNVCGTQHF